MGTEIYCIHYFQYTKCNVDFALKVEPCGHHNNDIIRKILNAVLGSSIKIHSNSNASNEKLLNTFQDCQEVAHYFFSFCCFSWQLNYTFLSIFRTQSTFTILKVLNKRPSGNSRREQNHSSNHARGDVSTFRRVLPQVIALSRF